MHIEHAALYVRNLTAAKAFFETYLGAKAGNLYHNAKTGFSSYFLSFGGGARLEIMTRQDLDDLQSSPHAVGYAHLAMSTGSRGAVDALTARLSDDGYEVISGPRMTGDGYYESCVCGIEGIWIEITV